jgi:hypothetical protein
MSRQKTRDVLCVRNGSYKASLEPRKVYRVVEDPRAEAISLLRVIDDTGEDYLFPAKLFVAVDVPTRASSAFARTASASGASRPARRSSRPTMR